MKVHVRVAVRVLTLRERKAFRSFTGDGTSRTALAEAVGVSPETIGGALNGALLNTGVLTKVEAFMVREGFTRAKRVSVRYVAPLTELGRMILDDMDAARSLGPAFRIPELHAAMQDLIRLGYVVTVGDGIHRKRVVTERGMVAYHRDVRSGG